MKIQPSSPLGAKTVKSINKDSNGHIPEPQDSVKIEGNEVTGEPFLSSLASKGVSREFAAKVLMGKSDVETTPLDQAGKTFSSLREWKSERMHGTSSTSMIFCPVNKCYYSGMLGKGKQDEAYGKKYLTAFNPDGSVKWTYDRESMTSDPAVDSKGNVYVRSQNSLIALDKDGKELWKCEAKGSSSTNVRERMFQIDYRKKSFEDHTPQVGPDGTVYILASGDGIGKEDGGVTAIRNGKEVWRSKAYPSADKGPRFVVKNGNIYVSRIDKEQRKKGFIFKEDVQRDVIACLNPDGSEKFRIYLSEQYVEGVTNPEEAKQFRVASDGSIYVYDNTRKFSKYSADGKKLWEHEVKSFSGSNNYEVWLQNPPEPTKDGNLIISVSQRRYSQNEITTVIAEMDGNGKVNWHKEFETRISGAPKIAPNGDIYFKTNDRKKGIDEIVHLAGNGTQLEKFTSKRKYSGIDAIQSYSFSPDGSLSVETLHTDGYNVDWNHSREIMVIPSYSQRNTEKNQEQEAGTIEKTKKFVVIGGVRVPINEGE